MAKKPKMDYEIHGFKLGMQSPSSGYMNHKNGARDERLKTVLYLRLGDKSYSVTVRAKAEAFEAAKEKKAAQLLLSHAEEIVAYAAAHSGETLSLATYRFLREGKISLTGKWLGKMDEYRQMWETTLSPKLGDISLGEVKIVEAVEAGLAEVFKRKQKHRTITDEELDCRRQIAAILRCAEQDGLLREGATATFNRKTRPKETHTMLNALARRSLSMSETEALVRSYVADDSEASRAALVRLLTGVNAYEVCALNVGDVRLHTFPTAAGATPQRLTYLRIDKEYRGKYRSELSMTSLLDNEHKYRTIPCTEVLALLLARQITLHIGNSGAVNRENPLFYNNYGRTTKQKEGDTRLDPATLLQYESKTIDDILVDRVYTPNGKGRKNGRFDGDMPRATAAFHLRHSGGMLAEEAEKVLGLRPETTYALNYVDWKHPYVMAAMAVKMARWHNKLLTVRGDKVLLLGHDRQDAALISTTAERDTELTITSAGGVGLSVYREPKNDI